ncbi:MAG: hypothetical protein IJ195_01350 [Lachnospiraceae bacterium]|nr:hypothetical protein [Lachnospiraceae bacterium]MBQ8138082.1 hypothetical protein [Lachnospiraceae bacterium]MBR1650217.1 hypothetical protein [Lachnospiraceae bacterium]
MKKRSYIFTNKKHPLIAIMSTVLGAVSLLSYAFAIVRSFTLVGNISLRFGFGGFLALVYSLIGAVLSLYSFKLKDTFHLFPAIGLVLNVLSLFVAGFLLWLPN